MVRRLDTSFTRDRARKLRKDPPASEKVVWQLIRAKQIGGFKFGRRRIVLGWIPNFWCPAAKLAIEIDGDESAWKIDRDARREKEFADQGIRTLHVSAEDIFRNPEKVIAQIGMALSATIPKASRGAS
jgi:very-short-patch-repair endonuclease